MSFYVNCVRLTFSSVFGLKLGLLWATPMSACFLLPPFLPSLKLTQWSFVCSCCGQTVTVKSSKNIFLSPESLDCDFSWPEGGQNSQEVIVCSLCFCKCSKTHIFKPEEEEMLVFYVVSMLRLLHVDILFLLWGRIKLLTTGNQWKIKKKSLWSSVT